MNEEKKKNESTIIGDKSLRSDRNKIAMQHHPKWFGKIIDCPVKEEYCYKAADQVVISNSNDNIISTSGVFEISQTINGVSRLRFDLNFINSKESENMFAQLINEVSWQQRSDKIDGKSYLQPRLTAWFGDLPYSYSGITWQPNVLSPLLKRIRNRLEEATGVHFNSVLANCYRDHTDNVSWHSDDETELGPQPVIASVSFGEKRRFYLRNKVNESEQVCIPLTAGSLLIMDGATQADWLHCIPQETENHGPRINLTYRVIFQQGEQPELL